MPGKPVSEAERDLIIASYNEGYSQAEIARQLGRHKHTIFKVLKKYAKSQIKQIKTEIK